MSIPYWIWTADLWCKKRPLCQLNHSQCPKSNTSYHYIFAFIQVSAVPVISCFISSCTQNHLSYPKAVYTHSLIISSNIFQEKFLWHLFSLFALRKKWVVCTTCLQKSTFASPLPPLLIQNLSYSVSLFLPESAFRLLDYLYNSWPFSTMKICPIA